MNIWVLRCVTVASSGCVHACVVWQLLYRSYIRHCEALTGWIEELDAKQEGAPTYLLNRGDEKRFGNQVVLRRGEGKCFSDLMFSTRDEGSFLFIFYFTIKWLRVCPASWQAPSLGWPPSIVTFCPKTLVIGLIEHVQIVTTRNCSAITNPHAQFTTACTKSSQSAVFSLVVW
jgi:hypothetical protein